METINEFYQWEGASRDVIDVKRLYIDMAGDLVSGVLLSQIVFWHLPYKNKSKLRVEYEGELWMAKTRDDWWEECRISPEQFDRAIKVLKNKGLVKTMVKKFNGNPTVHLRINEKEFIQGIKTILTKGEERYLPLANNDIGETPISITETTTEITAEINNKDKEEFSSVKDDATEPPKPEIPQDLNKVKEIKPPSVTPKIYPDLRTGQWAGVTDEVMKVWERAYPAVNIKQDLNKMIAWLLANPKKAPRKLYFKFATDWLSRTQDRGGTRNWNSARDKTRGKNGNSDTGYAQEDFGKFEGLSRIAE